MAVRRKFLDGAVFFIEESPILALSLRYDRLDSFWFNLCHEIGHIINGQGQSYLDFDLGNPELSVEVQANSEEKTANDFASEWLGTPGRIIAAYFTVFMTRFATSRWLKLKDKG